MPNRSEQTTGAERGQATVELALSLPVVAVLLAALIEVGWLVSDQTRLWHAAREAARVAIVDDDPAAARAAARRGGLEGVEVSLEPEGPDRSMGEPLSVQLVYDPPPHSPLSGYLFGWVRLRADATMRIELP